MASRYICRQCERKFIDWGAEKLGFKCPDCDDTELTPIEFEPVAKAKAKKKKPALKRGAKKKATKAKAKPRAKAKAKPRAKAKKKKSAVESADDVLAKKASAAALDDASALD